MIHNSLSLTTDALALKFKERETKKQVRIVVVQSQVNIFSNEVLTTNEIAEHREIKEETETH